jgi:hypothetical protein
MKDDQPYVIVRTDTYGQPFRYWSGWYWTGEVSLARQYPSANSARVAKHRLNHRFENMDLLKLMIEEVNLK